MPRVRNKEQPLLIRGGPPPSTWAPTALTQHRAPLSTVASDPIDTQLELCGRECGGASFMRWIPPSHAARPQGSSRGALQPRSLVTVLAWFACLGLAAPSAVPLAHPLVNGGPPAAGSNASASRLPANSGAATGFSSSVQCYAKCPRLAQCKSVKGSPVCVCPRGYHITARGCQSGLLPHSDYLDPHNNARAAVGAVPLQWSAQLAARAASWARVLATDPFYNCRLIHGDYGGMGQNLAGGMFPGWKTVSNSAAMNAFVAEGGMYTYTKFNTGSGGCSTGNWKDCGHYTQVIWNTSRLVGCAAVVCAGSKGKIWNCDYKPPGNGIGRYPYWRDPCYRVKCPSVSKCYAWSYAPHCVCPKGQALINRMCVRDPCLGVRCPGNLVCSRRTGHARCVCKSGYFLLNRLKCIPVSCRGVACPALSSCGVDSGTTPFCRCIPGYAMVKNKCTRAPRSRVVRTSLVLFNRPKFVNSPTWMGPQIVQAPWPRMCWNLPKIVAGRIGSYIILWNVPQSHLPPGSATTSCSVLYFWSDRNCYGKGLGWKNVNRFQLARSKASGVFQSASSISCR